MYTLSYKNIEYKVVCIDPTIETAGDGLTAASALKDFPAKLENNTCYVIRRTADAANQHCNINWQNDDSLVNVMILGMPKATDKEWIQDLIQVEEINTAWKNDEANYANIKFPHYGNKYTNTADNNVINSAKLEFLTVINTYCYRLEKTNYSSSSSYREVLSGMFGNDNVTTKLTNFGFYGCKFGVLGYDIDSDAFLAEHTDTDINLDGGANKYDQFGGCYVTVLAANSFRCEDCIINYHTNANDSYHGVTTQYGKAFSVESINTVYMNNNKVNIKCFSPTPAFVFRNILFSGTYRNTECNLILLTNRLTPLMYTYGYKRYGIINIDNTKIRIKKFINAPVSNALEGSYIYGGLILGYINDDNHEGYGKELSLTNFDVDCTIGDAKLAEGNFLSAHFMGDALGSPQPTIFKNISIKLHDVLDECFITNTNGTTYSTVVLNAYWHQNNGGTVTHGAAYLTSYAAIARIENLFVSSKLAGNVYLRNVVANIDRLEARLHTHTSTHVQINDLVFDKLDVPAIVIGEQSTVRVKNLKVVENKTSTEPVVSGLYNGYSNAIYIDNCNQEEVFDCVCDKETNVDYVNSIAICANAGAEGKFVARNRNTLAQSWSVIRNGSDSGASLRLSNNTTVDGKRIVVCPNPYKGFTVTPTKLGMQELVIYFAYKDFVKDQEAAGKSSFNPIVYLPTKNSLGEIKYLPITSVQDWYDDTSVWTDPEAVAKKIIIPINVEMIEPIEIKFSYNWYHPSGCVYVDPDMRLVVS